MRCSMRYWWCCNCSNRLHDGCLYVENVILVSELFCYSLSVLPNVSFRSQKAEHVEHKWCLNQRCKKKILLSRYSKMDKNRLSVTLLRSVLIVPYMLFSIPSATKPELEDLYGYQMWWPSLQCMDVNLNTRIKGVIIMWQNIVNHWLLKTEI